MINAGKINRIRVCSVRRRSSKAGDMSSEAGRLIQNKRSCSPLEGDAIARRLVQLERFAIGDGGDRCWPGSYIDAAVLMSRHVERGRCVVPVKDQRH